MIANFGVDPRFQGVPLLFPILHQKSRQADSAHVFVPVNQILCHSIPAQAGIKIIAMTILSFTL